LEKIKYTDALPTLRRLASEDRDVEVRSTAEKYVKKATENTEPCRTVLTAPPEIHQVRSPVPYLISTLKSNRYNDCTDNLRDALISIGVVDRESIDQLLDMAITKRTTRDVCLNAQQVLANQKTLPAYVGDAVIARIEKGDNCASLYPILIPVRTPQAIERYIKWTKESVVKPGFLDYQAEIGDFKYEFQRIGPAAIPALVDHFRKHDDLDSRAISVMALMTMQTVESLRAGRKLARQMLSPERPAAARASVTQEQASREEAESRARKLEGMVQLLGRELLVYLYLADEVRMRLELIGALRDIGYTDAVPALRRLADEDRDAEVRAGAAISAVVLERGHVDAKANGSRTPGIKIHENMGGKK
jgi:hypothetical protein